MSFWESDLGEITGTAQDAFAKSFKIIPDGTMALAKIDSFTVEEHEGFKYMSLLWLLIDGDFKGQKVTQKIKVFGGGVLDKDPLKTRHRALNMLKLLYQLFNLKPTHKNEPTNQDLALFHGKISGIQIRETVPNEKGNQYNWVSEVHPSQGFKSETGVSIVVTKVNYSSNSEDLFDSALSRHKQVANGDLDDDVPF